MSGDPARPDGDVTAAPPAGDVAAAEPADHAVGGHRGPGDAVTRGPVRVVGTGLLGASVGLALRALDVDVLLADPSPTSLALARDLGAGRVADDAPALVVVAAPPDVTAATVAAELAAWPQAVVTDVASVKASVLRDLCDAGADLSRYVGGHPMAGRERSGPAAARGDLFLGRPWVVSPAPGTRAQATAAVVGLATDVGATPVTLSAEQHDEMVALVSHVPQVAASLVAARLQDAPETAAALAGQGLRDMTRIAASDPQLWAQILAGNAAAVARVLRELVADLDGVLAAVDALAVEQLGHGDPAAVGARAVLARAIAAGNAGQARIPGKHGAPPTRYALVPVLVPDRPGELARLLAEVGEEGVNLEDLRLEHSPGQPVGLAEVSVLPAARAHLVDALRARGWTVPL